MINELWKDIPGFEGEYQASNIGRIKSLKKSYKTGKGYIRTVPDKLMICHKLTAKGYLRVSIKKRQYFIHRLIALTFIDNSLNKEQINHINGIKTDNRIENLEWVTNQENRNHAVNNNLIAFDIKLPQTKLTREEVIKIKQLYTDKGISQSILAKAFGVCQQTISKIVNNRSRIKFCD